VFDLISQYPVRRSFFSVSWLVLFVCSCTANDGPEHLYRSAPTGWSVTNVNIVDVLSGSVRSNQTVVVADGIIKRIEDSVRDPITTIDGSGKYLMPGLIDSHVHLFSNSDLVQYVANGVTGVQNMWGLEGGITLMGFPKTRTLIKEVESGGFGPAIWSAGPVLEGVEKSQPFMSSFATVESVREEVQRQHDNGYDFIKPYDHLDKEVYLAAVAAANDLQLPVKGHIPVSITLAEAVKLGVNQIEHMSGWVDSDNASIKIARQDRNALLQSMKAANVVVCPTLIVYRRVVPASQAGQFNSLPGKRSLGFMASAFEWMGARAMRDHVNIDIDEYPQQLRNIQNESLIAMYQSGVTIVAGTDAGNPFVYPGYSLIEELQLMHEAGMPIDAVIRSGTVNAAQALGEDNRGIIKQGAVADMILLDKNPLESLENLNSLVAVSLRGRFLSSEQLNEYLSD